MIFGTGKGQDGSQNHVVYAIAGDCINFLGHFLCDEDFEVNYELRIISTNHFNFERFVELTRLFGDSLK